MVQIAGVPTIGSPQLRLITFLTEDVYT